MASAHDRYVSRTMYINYARHTVSSKFNRYPRAHTFVARSHDSCLRIFGSKATRNESVYRVVSLTCSREHRRGDHWSFACFALFPPTVPAFLRLCPFPLPPRPPRRRPPASALLPPVLPQESPRPRAPSTVRNVRSFSHGQQSEIPPSV